MSEPFESLVAKIRANLSGLEKCQRDAKQKLDRFDDDAGKCLKLAESIFYGVIQKLSSFSAQLEKTGTSLSVGIPLSFYSVNKSSTWALITKSQLTHSQFSPM